MAGSERERPVAPPALPVTIGELVEGHCWARDLVGEAGCAVYRLHRPGGPDLYLKHGRGPFADDVVDEMVRLRWLAGQAAVPAVRHFAIDADDAWLLTTALPGRTAYQVLEGDPANGPAVVDALADFLRRLHALPVERCPFNSDHRLRLAMARDRMDAGLVDTDDFDEARRGWSTGQLWDELMALLPIAADRVVTHGDFSLDNILIVDGRVAGCIDVGRAGLADRYQDLAILWNCLGEFGAALQDRLFAGYGIGHPDARRLRFHLALDECF